MSIDHQRVVLVTGASSGIGLACAEHLHQRGYRVFGANRHPREDADWEHVSRDFYLKMIGK